MKKTSNRVRIDGYLADEFRSQVGTRQGCNLSPTLFNMYINYLPNFLKMKGGKPITLGSMNVNILMYADDMLRRSDSGEDLQPNLHAVNI